MREYKVCGSNYHPFGAPRRQWAQRNVKIGLVGYSINDNVSEVNPYPWHEWLGNQNHNATKRGVSWYNATNCHYIVARGRVFTCYGYHGQSQFNELSSPNGIEKNVHKRRKLHRVLNTLLRNFPDGGGYLPSIFNNRCKRWGRDTTVEDSPIT
jgi:hypothetical protein